MSCLRRTYQGQTVALYLKPRPRRPWWTNRWERQKRMTPTQRGLYTAATQMADIFETVQRALVARAISAFKVPAPRPSDPPCSPHSSSECS